MFIKFSEEGTETTATGFVGKLTFKKENGAEPVLVTNNHIFQSVDQARNASYTFGYHHNSHELQNPGLIQGNDLVPDNASFFYTHVSTSILLYSELKLLCFNKALYLGLNTLTSKTRPCWVILQWYI